MDEVFIAPNVEVCVGISEMPHKVQNVVQTACAKECVMAQLFGRYQEIMSAQLVVNFTANHCVLDILIVITSSRQEFEYYLHVISMIID